MGLRRPMDGEGANSLEGILFYFLTYLVVPTLLGVSGYLLLNFVGRDLIHFRDIRRESLHAIENTANVLKLYCDPDDYRQAVALLRNLGTRLRALNQTSNIVVRNYLRLRGYDLEKASAGFIGLSNSLDNTRWVRVAARYQIEKGLKFPHEMPEEDIEEMRKQETSQHF
ncbi:MAG: hypothetical protein RIE84_04450 [Parvibaculum sp.]|uniref:hypothetical protein n=1 Tax=Parvibaculum sp. TaxID=2024848 RepID=UPI0032EBDBB6